MGRKVHDRKNGHGEIRGQFLQERPQGFEAARGGGYRDNLDVVYAGNCCIISLHNHVPTITL